MADVVSPEKRSQMMSGIRGKDTRPEVLIRKQLHARGFRYRLHDRKLSGKPDIVLSRYRAVIFVHGCFWHGHDCHLFKWPSTREQFWKDKIITNQQNDSKSLNLLRSEGWRVLVLWECALKGRTRLQLGDVVEQIVHWLDSGTEIYELKGTD
ncbi:MAG: DNA mismatch endonuclease Vsr [Desulfuromonadales bacterium]|nr:MAG: DNA mismatch endonuclease Vsr [Desulfuromonadales bacterium]